MYFDVTGYFTMDAGGASYVPIAPQRILDTRPKSTSRPSNPIGFAGPLKARTAYTFAVTGKGGVPATGPVAVTGNVTITGQTAVGQLIVGPAETTGVLPGWNTLSSPTGQNRANGIVTGLNGTGRLSIMYWASSTSYTSHAIFDVSGYFK
jgi:hypothetical protein